MLSGCSDLVGIPMLSGCSDLVRPFININMQTGGLVEFTQS